VASDISDRLRDQVAERAKFRCEYCFIHEDQAAFPLQVDHIISRKHGGTSNFDNLAYACVLCNRYKGSDVAAIDPISHEAIRLFHPRRDAWTDHFRITSGILEALTASARVNVRLLRIDAPERAAERALLNVV